MEKKKLTETARYNAVTYYGYLAVSIILLASYLLELVKGNRTLVYTIIFAVFNLVPLVMCSIAYFKDKGTSLVKYIYATGYSIMYIYVLLTTNTNTTFTYIIVLFILLTPYADFKLSLFSTITAVAANAVQIIMEISAGKMDAATITASEVQIAIIVLSGLLSILTTRTSKSVGREKMKEINQEKETSANLLDKVLSISSVITTEIDNTSSKVEVLEHSVDATRISMQDVSNGSTETAESVQEQLLKTEEIVEHIDKVKNVANTIASDMNKTDRAIEIGKEKVEQLVTQVKQSEEVGNTVSVKMQELHENTEKMNDIVELINSITKQTSMLSLNASIEAARAGEAGKGFAVVANEISNLAKQTSDATVNITDLIRGIAASIDDVFDSMNHLMESNKVQNETAGTIETDFEDIEDSAKNISVLSGELSDVVVKLSDANKVIVESIHNISAITEEVSARASETYTESENNSTVVDEIAALMTKLQKKAQELKQ